MRVPEIGSIDYVKYLNTQRVYQIILQQQPLSRTQIARISGISKVTVSSCVDILLNCQVVTETTAPDTARGRRPILISINPRCGILIGVETDALFTRIVVTDFAGQLLESKEKETPGMEEPDAFMEWLNTEILCFKSKYSGYGRVLGVGIALAGYYDQEQHKVSYVATRPSWLNYPLDEKFHEFFPDIPLRVERQANSGAVGVSSYEYTDSRCLAYLSCSWGLGVGVYINQKEHRGLLSSSSRFGHVTINCRGRACSCGNRGCLEAYASVSALYRQIYQKTLPESWKYHTLLDRYYHKDPRIAEEVESIKEALSVGIINVINAYQPDTIVIGGPLCQFLNDEDLQRIKNDVEQMVPPPFRKNFRLVFSSLKENSVTLGCVSLIRYNILEYI